MSTASARSVPPHVTVALAGMLGSLAAGALVTASPSLAVAGGALALALLTAALYPVATVRWGVAATSLYAGIYLHYRVDVAGAPLSALDVFPVLLFVSALRLRQVEQSRRWAPTLRKATALLVGGLVLGALIGIARHAPIYEWLKVIRIEWALIVGLIAAAVGAQSLTWCRAVKDGLMLAGALAALQIILSAAWLLATNDSFWEKFAFGEAVGDVDSELRAGNVNILRTNMISTYLMLPAFCLAAIRLRRRDVLLIGVILLASVVSLSRGYWIALGLTVALTTAQRLIVARDAFGRWVRTVAVLSFSLFAAALLLGGLAAQRVEDTGSASDRSADYRLAETEAAVSVIKADPLAVVLGTGAGVTSVAVDAATAGSKEPGPLLENTVLSRWLNLTLLSLLGVSLLLLGSFAQAWRTASSSTTYSQLAAMGLCLPALLVSGLFGGTLMSAQGTLPFWLLAATLLAHRDGMVPNLSERQA